MNLGTLMVHVGADTKGLDRGMNRAKRKMRSASRAIKRSAKMATVALAGIGAASAYFVKAASDSEELNNVVNQSFGEMADSINNWAGTTGDAMNRSTYQMRRFAALNQAILKPMLGTSEATAGMSKDLTQLAVDLGSFFNVADNQAFEAIQSGLMGMVRPLRQFGIDLTQATLEAYALEKGLDANLEKMSQAEKVQLRYNYLMDNTAHIQGDAVRTAGTLANQLKGLEGQWRNLRTEFGNYLLPAATKVITKVSDMVEYLADLPGSVQRNIVKFGALATAVLSAVAALGLMVIVVETILKGLALLGALFGLVTSPVVIGALAIAAASYALYTAWTENWGGIRDKTTAIWNDHLEPIYEKMKDWMGTAWDWIIETGGNAWNWIKDTTWKEKWEDIKSWMQKGWNWVIDIAGEGWDWLDKKAPALTGALETGWDWSVSLVNDTAKWIKETVWPWIEENKPVKTAWHWAVKAVNKLFTWIVTTAYPWFDSSVTTTWNFLVEGIDKVMQAWNWMNRNVGENKLNIGGNQSGQSAVQNPLNWAYNKAIDLFDIIGGSNRSILGPGNKAGGMTGNVGINQVAGVVHGGEWVMPNWMMKKYPQLAGMLEGMRKRGYKSGGFVGSVGTAVQNMDLSGIGGWIKDLSIDMSRISEVFIRVMKSFVDIMIKLLNVIGDSLGIGKIGDELKSTLQDLNKWFDGLFQGEGKPSGKGSRAIDQQQFFGNGQNSTPQQMTIFQRALKGASDVMLGVMDGLKQGMPVLQSLMAEGGGFKSWVGIITSLITNSKAFQTILETINPVLQLLADTIGIVLLPIVKILEPPLRLVAEVLRWVAGLIVKVWNGIVDVLDIIIFWTSLDKWKVSMKELDDNLEDTSKAAKDAADAMRNVPNGVKVALRGFQSAQGTKQRAMIPSAHTGATVTRAGLVNVDAGEIIKTPSQQGSNIVINFNGDVYGERDFERKVNKAVDNAKRRNGMNKYGLQVGGN